MGGTICDRGACIATDATELSGTDRLRLESPQGREKDLHEKLTLVCVCVCVSASLNMQNMIYYAFSTWSSLTISA